MVSGALFCCFTLLFSPAPRSALSSESVVAESGGKGKERKKGLGKARGKEVATMSIKSPIFPMTEPQHFSDYGFDPRMDYFQVLEEAKKHRRDNRSVDALHFKLQKPISKEDFKKNKKRKWWRNALLFWKWKRNEEAPTLARRYRTVSGPIYALESGLSKPCRTTRPSSGPLACTLNPMRKGEFEIPYLNLRDLNLDSQRISTSSMPIYLVT